MKLKSSSLSRNTEHSHGWPFSCLVPLAAEKLSRVRILQAVDMKIGLPLPDVHGYVKGTWRPVLYRSDPSFQLW
jgi:hypothetical protein